MKNMKNWLVELNAAVLSTEAMNNIIMLANQLKPEKIHFLHIARQVELPSELESEFPDLQQVELKSVSEKIQDKVGLQLPKETKCIVTTKIGNSLAELFHTAKEENSDVIVCTNESPIKKMLKNAPCHLLVVPVKQLHITELFSPIDLSDQTGSSLEWINGLNEQLNIDKVAAMHFYKDASHYINQVCESPFEVEEVVKERNALNLKLQTYAKYKINGFINSNKHLPNLMVDEYMLARGAELGETMRKVINNTKAQMILLTTSRVSSSKPGILANATDILNEYQNDKYYLITKRKEETAGLFKSLLNFA